MTAQVLASANRGGRNGPRNARGPKAPKGNAKQPANANANTQGQAQAKERSHRGLGPAVPGRGVKKEVVAAVEAHVGKQQQVG